MFENINLRAFQNMLFIGRRLFSQTVGASRLNTKFQL